MRRLSAALIFLLVFSALLCLAAPAFLEADTVRAMIDGLDGLRVISPEEAKTFPEPSGTVELTLAGAPLPYDAEANAYLIPQSAETEGFDGAVELRREAGYTYYLCPSAAGGKAEALSGNVEYGIYAVRGDSCRFSRVLFTPQTVLCLTADSGELPGEERGEGDLAVYSVRDGRIVREQAHVEVNERGNTSRRFPKKSYRLHIQNAQGDKHHLDIAGLRSDDDWILNPLYADTSKIRERLGYELWDAFNSSGSRAAASRLVHVEVFLNGAYWGLYGLQERVDFKQLDGDKRADLLYKVVANDRPTAEELLSCASTGRYRAFELQNGDTAGADDLWMPAAAYIAYLDGQDMAGAALNIDNVVDYGLWAMFTQAHDNHFKNQFLNAVHESGRYALYKIPWDLNHTFGDVWRGEDEENNFTGYMVGSLVMDGAFEEYLARGGDEAALAVAARWRQLRSGGLTAEAVIARAREMHGEIAGARMRDSLRWPQCGMGEGNAMNIRDIEDFVETMFVRMDEYIEELASGA